MTPALSVAVGDYDHVRDLVSGSIRPDGLDITCQVIGTPEELFERLLTGGEFDVAEMSLAVFCALRARDDSSFVGLPVFPGRSFRHSAIFTRADGPRRPAELAGARIGVPVWAQTAGVYVRGMLATEHGIRLKDIDWVQAGVDVPGRVEPVAIDYGPFKVTPAPERSLDDLLLTGDVDAVISARPPACVERADPRVRRFFADPVAAEMASFAATGVFPIMHTMVLRRAAFEAHPHAAGSLFAAFEEAKRRSLRRVAAATVPSLPLPWAAAQARQARSLIGEDWWPYGVEANRPTLSAFLSFAWEQGLTERLLAPEDLYPDESGALGA